MAKNSEHIVYTIEITEKGTYKVQELNLEVDEASQLFEKLNENITKNTNASRLNADALQANISQLKKLRDTTTTTNELYRKQTDQIRILEKEYRKLTAVTNTQTDKTGLASATLVEFSRGIQDANYGFRGIANNLSQLTTLMTTLIGTTGGLKNAFTSLKNAFTGPIGFLVVANLVIAFFERLEIKSQKSTESIKENTDAIEENIKKRREQLKLLKGNIDTLTVELERLLKVGGIGTGTGIDTLTAEQTMFAIQALLLEAGAKEASMLTDANLFIEDRVELALQLYQREKLQLDLDKEIKALNEETNDAKKRTHLESIARIQEQIKFNADLIDSIVNVDDVEVKSKKKKQKTEEQLEKERLDFEKSVEDALAVWEEQKWLLERERLQEHYDKLIEMTRAKGESTIALEMAKFAALKQMDEKREEDLKAKEEKEKAEEEREVVRQIRISQAQVRVEEEALKQHQKIAQARIGFATQVSGILQTLAGENEEMAKVGLILEKGAAIADIVIKSQQSVATQTAASAAFKLKTEAAYAGLPGGFLVAKGLIAANQMSLKKNILNTKISAGLSIAQILATSLAPKGNDIASVSAPSESSTSAPQIQAPSFNVVGATQQSQLAQAISGQEEKPIKAFVVADDVTTTQELLRKAVEGATLG